MKTEKKNPCLILPTNLNMQIGSKNMFNNIVVDQPISKLFCNGPSTKGESMNFYSYICTDMIPHKQRGIFICILIIKWLLSKFVLVSYKEKRMIDTREAENSFTGL